MRLRILLADSHAAARRSLMTAIEDEKELEVVAEAEDGWSAVSLARKLRPDIVIMDVIMPEISGIEAAREIVTTMPETRVIGWSVHTNKHYVTEMLKAGAAAYLLKTCSLKDLLRAVKAAAEEKKSQADNERQARI